MQMVIVGYVILTSIEVVISKVVLESLQMLLQVGVAIIGLVMRVIKNQEIVV